VTFRPRTDGLPSIVGDTLDAALGRTHRHDPVAAGTGGPAGNARLTAWTGLLLLVLSVAEVITLIDVGGLISWHIVIGTLLIPPALLKTASTGWRIARYYNGTRPYRQAGPPPMLLRILGPGVIVFTLGLLASGVLLVFLGVNRSRTVVITALGQRVDWVTVHQGLFIGWAVLTGLHVLARVVTALRLTVLQNVAGDIDGGRARAALLVATVVAATVAAWFVLAAAASWQGDQNHEPHHRGGQVDPSARP
jgi:hypothetical protein